MSNIELPPTLLDELRSLIIQSRQQASRSINTIQVQTYWQIGRHIIEFEQGGQTRAVYGKNLLTNLANALTGEFGKGFDASNLRYMRLFYQAFPNCDALRHELSWTHYRLLLRVDTPEARLWYVREAATQNWSTRVLERQISSLYYDRLLSSPKRDRLLDKLVVLKSHRQKSLRGCLKHYAKPDLIAQEQDVWQTIASEKHTHC